MGFLGVMTKFGFCEKWRNLIHGCFCNEHFGVLVDGVPHGYFPASRGLRQGFQTGKFILAEEVLSRGLQELVSLKIRTPYHGSRSCPALSHFIFANDVRILYNGHKRNLKKLQIFLETSKKLIVML